MQCGLLGRKLGHSFSPQIHKHLGNYQYDIFEKEPNQLEDFLLRGTVCGLNVTMPYKKDVIPYCTELSAEASKIGAVNTIVRRSDGTLIGHNTDYYGFASLLDNYKICVHNKKVLVLGSGGASVTVQCVLQERNAQVVVISRSGSDNYDNIHLHSDAAYIVNTTPVGMYPDTGISPVSLDQFPQLEGVVDLIYNPARTELLIQAEERGLVAVNGLWMLVAQAKESAEWFTGSEIDDDLIASIHHNLETATQNIILIGMPGSGKSTVGKELAEALSKTFIDADAELVHTSGRAIPEIFSTDGEPAFRELEHQVLKSLGKRSGLVIATGGGCVTRKDNYRLLHQNGTIVWLQRDLELLPIEGRPLSQTNTPEDMYAIRKPQYAAFSDISVRNNAEIPEVVRTILSKLNPEV